MRTFILSVIGMRSDGLMLPSMQIPALRAVLREAFMARRKDTGAGRG